MELFIFTFLIQIMMKLVVWNDVSFASFGIISRTEKITELLSVIASLIVST